MNKQAEGIPWVVIGIILALIVLLSSWGVISQFGTFRNPFGDDGKFENITDEINKLKDDLAQKQRNDELSAGDEIVAAALNYQTCPYAPTTTVDLRNCDLPQGGWTPGTCPMPDCQFQCSDLVKKSLYDAGLWETNTGTPMGSNDLIGEGKTLCSPVRSSASKYDIDPSSIKTLTPSEIASSDLDDIQRGEIFALKYTDDNKAGHAGIYLGDGKVIHAVSSGVGIADIKSVASWPDVESITFCSVMA